MYPTHAMTRGNLRGLLDCDNIKRVRDITIRANSESSVTATNSGESFDGYTHAVQVWPSGFELRRWRGDDRGHGDIPVKTPHAAIAAAWLVGEKL